MSLYSILIIKFELLTAEVRNAIFCKNHVSLTSYHIVKYEQQNFLRFLRIHKNACHNKQINWIQWVTWFFLSWYYKHFTMCASTSIYAFTFRKVDVVSAVSRQLLRFVGFGPQTTLGGKWAVINAASTLKISRPWAKPPAWKFDFCEVFLFVT